MEQAIKLWVNQILNRKIKDLTIVKDCKVVRDMLELLEPDHFSRNRLESMDDMMQAIEKFYRDAHRIDVSSKVKSWKKKEDVLGMWELLLGIAIKCPERNTYIKMILNLDQQSMAALMSFINMISEDCPQMSISQSRVEDGKDQKLEKALLSAIDDLTEENDHIRGQVEQLEEQLESQKTLSAEKIAQLKQIIEDLQNQRLEVLGEYEAEYCSDSLLSIFRSMETERDQLRVMLESRETTIGVMETATKEMMHQFAMVKQQNQQMKRQFDHVKELERQTEQAQLTIRELRESEKKYINEIYELEEKRIHLKKKLNRANEFVDGQQDTRSTKNTEPAQRQLMQNRDKIQPQLSNQANKAAQQQTYTHKIEPNSGQEGHALTTIKTQLKPFVREQANSIKVKKLQKLISELNDRLRHKDLEIKDLQSRHLNKNARNQKLASKYVSETLREKEAFASDKQQQYQNKFTDLLKEIQLLKRDEKILAESSGEIQKQATGEKRQLWVEYNLKIEKIIDMLQTQLTEFRDKELTYVDTIRQLNIKIDSQQTEPQNYKPQLVQSTQAVNHLEEITDLNQDNSLRAILKINDDTPITSNQKQQASHLQRHGIISQTQKQKQIEGLTIMAKENIQSKPVKQNEISPSFISQTQTTVTNIPVLSDQHADDEVLKTLEQQNIQLDNQIHVYHYTADTLIRKAEQINTQLLQVQKQLSNRDQQIRDLEPGRNRYSILIEQLQQKCSALESVIASQHASAEELPSFVDKITQMVNQIVQLKQKQTCSDSIIQALKLELNNKNTYINQLQYKIKQQPNGQPNVCIRALKHTNTKLIDQMNTQQRNVQMFRQKFCNMQQKYNSIWEQNQILVCAVADLRTMAKAQLQNRRLINKLF